MKELLKIINKKILVISIILSILYYICEFGTSFVLAKYLVAPFTLEKATSLCITMGIVYTLMLITDWFIGYINNVWFPIIEIEIQRYYFKKVQKMTSSKINDTHTGYIYNLIKDVSRILADLIWYFSNSILPLIIAVISFLYMACKQSVIMGILCISICTIAVYLKYYLRLKRKKYDKELRSRHSKYVAILIDFIQNITTVRKLNIGKFCDDKLDNQVSYYKQMIHKNEIKRANQNRLFDLLIRCVYIIIFIMAIFMIKNGQDALPYIAFYLSLMGNVWSKLNSLTRLLDGNVEFKTAKKQLDEFFKDSKELDLVKKWSKVELKDTIFQYGKDLDKIKIPYFCLKRGDKISIMGESGQGKSTTMNILAGIYPLDKGSLLIDGKEVKDQKLDLVFVSQEVDLFDLSVRDNLCLGKDVPVEKIENLLKDAGLFEWYKNLPDGLDTLVGEKGVKLSAGQKQRLNIIRGILIDKDLYFFDEPTSNLDSLSEEKITNMIDKYLNNKTYVIVTHRPRIKELCNKHYVFENHIMKEMVNV